MTKKSKQKIDDAAQAGRWTCYSILAGIIALHILSSSPNGLW